MSRIQKISEFSIYTALAFIFSYIESLLPLPLPFPGMKLGLANLVIVILLYKKDFRYTLAISMLRNLLNAFTFGSLFSLMYSLAGSFLSLLVMAGMKHHETHRSLEKKTHCSILSVSALGGIFHNVGQFITASFLVGFHSVLWYLPILYFSGLVTGILIGWLSSQVLKRIKYLHV